MTPIEVSIIIVNYNTRDLLKNCIKSVKETTHGLSYEIIVIDNLSSDHSQEMIKTEFPEVHLIESPVNLGFGKANNLGFKFARGNVFLLLNSDTLLIDNSIKILYDYLISHPQVGVCGGTLLDKQKNPNLSYGHFLSLYREIWEIIKSPFRHSPQNPAYIKEVDYITGADMMVKREVIEKTQGFDPDFFLYYEETELSYRIKKAGYKIHFIPQAQIIHLDGSSGLAKKNLNERILQEKFFSRFLYFQKNYGPRQAQYAYLMHKIQCQFAIFIFTLIQKPQKLLYWKKKYEIIKQGYQKLKKMPRTLKATPL